MKLILKSTVQVMPIMQRLQEQLVKNANEGVIVFNDLIINRPGTGYKFLIYTNDGEIIANTYSRI